ncbi:unnamed protein product [Caenorhabditis auriculariae]|uniref:Uncharacterized protein n=1 Tax=Caenorhabditis auriculariae TaxID=2777116 RepID=A0A8S1GVM1_9PELO|nr:unnamed protein product [Caenorhabditis auriculariae]
MASRPSPMRSGRLFFNGALVPIRSIASRTRWVLQYFDSMGRAKANCRRRRTRSPDSRAKNQSKIRSSSGSPDRPRTRNYSTKKAEETRDYTSERRRSSRTLKKRAPASPPEPTSKRRGRLPAAKRTTKKQRQKTETPSVEPSPEKNVEEEEKQEEEVEVEEEEGDRLSEELSDESPSPESPDSPNPELVDVEVLPTFCAPYPVRRPQTPVDEVEECEEPEPDEIDVGPSVSDEHTFAYPAIPKIEPTESAQARDRTLTPFITAGGKLAGAKTRSVWQHQTPTDWRNIRSPAICLADATEEQTEAFR